MSDAQASAHSLKQTQSLVCFLLHLNVFNNVLKPQCWNSQIQRRWKQITSSHRCTSAKYLTWYIAPRCYWDQRPHEYSNEMFNLCWRDYWKATEVSRILPKASLKSCYAPAWMTCWDTKTKIKVGYPPRSLRGGRKKNLKSACWHFKPQAKSNMSAEQVFLNSAQHDGALRNCLGLNFTKKKKRPALRWKLKKKKTTSPLHVLRNQLNNFMQGLFSITEIEQRCTAMQSHNLNCMLISISDFLQRTDPV